MFLFSKSPFYNKKLSDYCKQTNMKSIRRIVENYKKNELILDKNKYKLVSTLYTPVPPPNFNNIFIFVSLSSMFLYFFINKKFIS